MASTAPPRAMPGMRTTRERALADEDCPSDIQSDEVADTVRAAVADGLEGSGNGLNERLCSQRAGLSLRPSLTR